MKDDPQRQLLHILISSITPNPRNPRKHDRAQVRAIAKSIKSFGFNAPLLLDRNGQVVAGHGRLEAAKLLGLETVPAIALDDLTEAQARAYMLADNKLTDRSSWDDQLLAANLSDLSKLVVEFDIEDTGFDTAEIDIRIQGLDDETDVDALDDYAAPIGPAVSQPGDLWLLGPHKVYCGSALDAGSYAAVLGSEVADVVFTDLPYNVKIGGNVSGLGAVVHREFVMASGEMDAKQFTEFLCVSLSHMARSTRPGGLLYACMDWRHQGELLAASDSAGLELLNMCVWVKTNGGMGSLYRSQYELVYVFRNGAAPHRNNVQLGRYGRNRSNVWTYPGATSFARGRKAALGLHPTVKPTRLVADAILDCTARGEIVLDPFLGSGTTILAAENTGRRGFGIELDPLYVDTAVARWQEMTGQTARLTSGGTFHETKASRSAQ